MSDPLTHTIYLDHAAAAPLDAQVLKAMLPHLESNYGNTSSIHHVGRKAFDTLSEARHSIATILNVADREIIFTGSGTESDNLAILGLARANRNRGNHVIVSSIEHKAVLEAAAVLKNEGFSITYLPVDEYGRVQLTTLRSALTDQTILVSIMYANNEIGTIQPISEIAALLRDRYDHDKKPIFHTDACQAAGALPLTPKTLGVDAMTLNSAKIYGPKGIGLLYLQSGIAIQPLLVGGGQEEGRRAGTENVALAVGFAKALEIAFNRHDTESCQLAALRDHFLTQLQKAIPSLLLNGHPINRLPNNLHLCIPHVEGEAMLLLLDAAGICAATGSACNASDLEPSHVLTAIGRDESIIHGSLRFTLGRGTTKTELDTTVTVLATIVERLHSISASPLALKKSYAKRT